MLADFLSPLLQSVPQVPGTEPKFSASMSFSVEVLSELAASRVSKLPGDVFTFHLVDPLMRRIVKRKLEPHRVQELVNLTITYFQKHPDSAVHKSLLRGSLPFTVSGYLSAFTKLFEDQLVALLRLRQDDRYKSFSVYQSILNAAQQPKRYRLLQLIFLCDKGLELTLIPMKVLPNYLLNGGPRLSS